MLFEYLQAHYGGGYACDYPGCTSVFKENAKLKRHKLVHTGEKAFKCDYCGLSFSLRHNLKTHEKTHTRWAVSSFMLKWNIVNSHCIPGLTC